MFLKSIYVDDTLGEDKIKKVRFEYLNKDFPIELSRYIKNHVVEVFRRKSTLNYRAAKVLKGHTRAIRRVYRVKEIDRVCRLEMSRRARKK